MQTDAPIDIEELVDRCIDDVGFVREILAVFRNQAQTHLRLMRERISAGDLIGMRKIAHAMKGSAANLAAGRLSELCGDLEQGRDDSPAAIEKSVSAVIRELDRCVAFFPTVCDRLDGRIS